jgi:hypothetical protein
MGGRVQAGCSHEIDEGALPEWDPRFGKVYVCKKCGGKVFKPSYYHPMPGKKQHRSKKERRRSRNRTD